MNRSLRVFQITSLLLLFVCFAQAAWWVIEETLHADRMREQTLELYAADSRAANELLALGAAAERVEELLSRVAVVDGRAVIRPDALDALDEARHRRINRFAWEGSFFLLVLLAGMGVIVQALRANTELLRRQQNFLASVSHELKSPLASIKLSAETLLLRRPAPETVERLANRMVHDSDRLTTLVSNVLDVARLEEGRAHVAPTVQPLRPLVDSSLRGLQHDLDGIEVAVDVADDLTVWADGEAMCACVRNLVSNAAKSVASARREGGALAGGGIAIRACAVGAQRVEIAVVDDGVGFPRQEKRRIFQKFYRPGDELRRRTKGSGLGLYLVRHLAALHDARVSGASPGPGQGAIFTLRWPSVPTGSAEERGA